MISMTKLFAVALVAGAAITVLGDGAQAATVIDFDGDKNSEPYTEELFDVAPNRIVNGNCH